MTAKLGDDIEKKILETIPLGEAERSSNSSYQMDLTPGNFEQNM